MTAFIFPGQGSQHKGMGKDLFDQFRQLVVVANDILGYSIEELCLNDPDRSLNQTQYTQPALYTVNALLYFKTLADRGQAPDYVAGHSLGEYNALLAAEVFDFATGLQLVKKRGELMSQATSGGMAAVLGLSQEMIQDVLRQHGLHQVCIANFNTPSQMVISGAQAEVMQAQAVLDAMADARCIPLNVSGAFHSPLMAPAQQAFHQYLSSFTFAKPSISVISNVTARPYPPEQIEKLLSAQITSPVQWTDTIRYLMGVGESQIEEIGPGQTLSKLGKSIQHEAAPLALGNEFIQNGAAQPVNPVNGQGHPTPTAHRQAGISPTALGSRSFKADYNLRYAYYAGAMYKGIASKELVVRMGKAGLMGFLGTGGMRPEEIEDAIRYIQSELSEGQSYGMNLLSNPALPEVEERAVDLYRSYGIRNIEASAYMQISPALARFRLQGLQRATDGTIVRTNRIIAKVSRPEVAMVFLSPAPERIVEKLLSMGHITPEQAALSPYVPVADDLCVEADSAGHTDQGVAYAILPTMIRLRDQVVQERGYTQEIRVGAAGGIGTPEAALAAFMLGADFIVTGSINQCTVEAGTSDVVKDMLQAINVQDTDYAPAGDMFELGAKIQVLKKGVFFAARANKLYDLYRQHNSLDTIDTHTKDQIQQRYFQRSFDDVWADTKAYYQASHPEEIDRAERNPKHKMALIFKWYFVYTSQLALRGDMSRKVDFQVHCGPALGAFNQWVKGTELEDWRNRHVDIIAQRLLHATSDLVTKSLNTYLHAEPMAHAS